MTHQPDAPFSRLHDPSASWCNGEGGYLDVKHAQSMDSPEPELIDSSDDGHGHSRYPSQLMLFDEVDMQDAPKGGDGRSSSRTPFSGLSNTIQARWVKKEPTRSQMLKAHSRTMSGRVVQMSRLKLDNRWVGLQILSTLPEPNDEQLLSI